MRHGTSKMKIRKCLKKKTKSMTDWDNKPQIGGNKNSVSLIKRMMKATISEDEHFNK